jgi:hypothetical protein
MVQLSIESAQLQRHHCCESGLDLADLAHLYFCKTAEFVHRLRDTTAQLVYLLRDNTSNGIGIRLPESAT